MPGWELPKNQFIKLLSLNDIDERMSILYSLNMKDSTWFSFYLKVY